MNMTQTKSALLRAGRKLFATRGYEATSVRDITTLAEVNLGAVTYHFASKEALYHAVIEEITVPMRDRLAAPLPDGDALDLLEVFLRGNFEFLASNADLPRIVLHVLASEGTLPPPGLKMIRLNLKRVIALIQRGQRQGVIRKGNARHLAMAVAGQPIMLGIYRGALMQTIDFDPFGRARKKVADDVVQFVRAGLARKETTT
jgi:AcrR family transcriptional regulator